MRGARGARVDGGTLAPCRILTHWPCGGLRLRREPRGSHFESVSLVSLGAVSFGEAHRCFEVLQLALRAPSNVRDSEAQGEQELRIVAAATAAMAARPGTTPVAAAPTAAMAGAIMRQSSAAAGPGRSAEAAAAGAAAAGAAAGAGGAATAAAAAGAAAGAVAASRRHAVLCRGWSSSAAGAPGAAGGSRHGHTGHAPTCARGDERRRRGPVGGTACFGRHYGRGHGRRRRRRRLQHLHRPVLPPTPIAFGGAQVASAIAVRGAILEPAGTGDPQLAGSREQDEGSIHQALRRGRREGSGQHTASATASRTLGSRAQHGGPADALRAGPPGARVHA